MLTSPASSSRAIQTEDINHYQNDSRQAMEKLFWLGGRLLYWQWFQMQCYGLEYIPQDRPYLIAANHTSHLDAGVIFASLWEHTDRVYSLVAKDYFCDKAIKEWFVRTFFNAIPFNRQGKFIEGIRDCQQVLKPRQPVLIFPEGTRSRTGQLQSLKPGLGFLAVKLNVPIIPVYIAGTYQALPKGQCLPYRYPIQVYFGLPLEIGPYLGRQNTTNNRQLYMEIVEDVGKAVNLLYTNA
jgi:long-chain acyl-CoA synthetase